MIFLIQIFARIFCVDTFWNFAQRLTRRVHAFRSSEFGLRERRKANSSCIGKDCLATGTVRSSSVRTRFASELVVVVALSACVSGMQAERGISEAFVVVASAFHAVEPGRTYLCNPLLLFF